MIERPGLEQLDPGAMPDGTYSLTISGSTITGLTAVPQRLVPLTTVINGDPALVWDQTELVYTEIL